LIASSALRRHRSLIAHDTDRLARQLSQSPACYKLFRMASKDKGRKEVKKKPKPKPKAEPGRKREEWISSAKPPGQA